MSTKKEEKFHKICDVKENSVAKHLGIKPGDYLLSVNNKQIKDIFDYETLISEQEIILEIKNSIDEIILYDISMDEDEEIGLVFEDYLMDEEATCNNKCVFCFVDQLPKNLRKTLYFKDDDLRLSFLSGNYVTLTNTSDKELDRLISYRLSPMNISVHATNPDVRVLMMKNKRAGEIMAQLRKIANCGIILNTQVVICPGYNDGEVLEETIRDLESIGNQVKSIAIVPVGLTMHRANKQLDPVTPMTQEDAQIAIEVVEKWQKSFLNKRGRHLIYAADEMYIKAKIPFPDAKTYDDFPQLENGVGLVSLFTKEMNKGIKKRLANIKNTQIVYDERVYIITGKDAAPIIKNYEKSLSEIYGKGFVVKPIINKFFGESVSVAGLVTAGDIINTLKEESIGSKDSLILPDRMIKPEDEVFLDDMTLEQFKDNFNAKVFVASSGAEMFLNELDEIFGRKN